MFGPFERMVAWRYLRAKRKDGFVSLVALISFVGILVGVAALLVTAAVTGGFRDRLEREILGRSGHITVEAVDEAAATPLIPIEAPLLDDLAQDARIKAVVPVVEEQAMVTANGRAVGAIARAVPEDLDPEQTAQSGRLVGHLLEGDPKQLTRWNAFVSLSLAQQLGLKVDSKFDLVSPKGNITPLGWSPRIKTFTVKGLVELDNDTGIVVLPLRAAQIFFKVKGGITKAELVTHDPKNISAITQDLTSQLGEGYRVQNWKDYNRAYVGALEVERVVTLLILTLVVLVAVFNIVTGQTMLVREKATGIAVMRTMGASQGAMQRVFLLSGAMIGLIGTLLGAILGLAIAWNFQAIVGWFQTGPLANSVGRNVGWLAGVEPQLSTTAIIAIIALAILLSILATIYPARRAANIDPVEALRYE